MLKKFKIDIKVLKEMDFTLFIVTILISLFGIINIYEATRMMKGNFTRNQLIFLLISVVILYISLHFDYSLLRNYVEIFYWGNIVLLIATKFIGVTVNGAQGWIRFPGGYQFQPAEFMKFAMILMLAKKMDQFDLKVNDFKNFMILVAYCVLPMGIIMKQPDMGMAMVCFFIALGIFFCAGLDYKIIGGGLIAVLLGIIILWNSPLIKDYQKTRVRALLNQEADELSTNLQLTQSMIGIGSGGILGTGPSFGSDTSRSYVAAFVPESETDFIFAIIAEHWGTIGSTILLILYGILIYRMIVDAKEAKDIFGSMICAGFTSYFIFAILQNIGMTIGIMPITGITLPLVSSGGSSLVTTFIAIALILNISMRKKKIYF
ncbi:rod shape determining protein RodA [Clostridium cavendishii DSM 21758]|uniref:Rod shape determining protein RodA n=1 Tax=Clostridium cavendishii DSM 21758 TaxID=1121302 RepID=A0A1M6BJP5_9CLOT|nr:rod shape-determining protein RodA [Clostridium cavendishii]SHI48945.1 rod shape determining protein RodA [Clostridium cavendishii DSM 21758]